MFKQGEIANDKTTALEESNFFYRLLYRDILSFTFAD